MGGLLLFGAVGRDGICGLCRDDGVGGRWCGCRCRLKSSGRPGKNEQEQAGGERAQGDDQN